MDAGMIEQLADYGILGIAVIGLAYVGWRLWQDLHTSWQGRLTDTRELITAVHDASRNYAGLSSTLANRAADLEEIASTTRRTETHLVSLADSMRLYQDAAAEHARLLERILEHIERAGGTPRNSNGPRAHE